MLKRQFGNQFCLSPDGKLNIKLQCVVDEWPDSSQMGRMDLLIHCNLSLCASPPRSERLTLPSVNILWKNIHLDMNRLWGGFTLHCFVCLLLLFLALCLSAVKTLQPFLITQSLWRWFLLYPFKNKILEFNWCRKRSPTAIFSTQ